MVDRPPQAQCHGLRDGLTPKMGPNPADLIALDPLDAVQAPSQTDRFIHVSLSDS
jgi:hypothetical protein